MYLEKINVETILPCHLDPEKIKVIGRMETDIAELMPRLVTYLKTKVKAVLYNKGAGTITFKEDPHIFTIHSDKVAVTFLEDTDEAEKFFQQAISLINEAYALQEELEPTLESNKPLAPFEIYKHLPQTNCRCCGEGGCLAFATKLSRQEAGLSKCGLIYEAEFTAKREALLEKMEQAGYGL